MGRMDSSLKMNVMLKCFYLCLCCLILVSCFSGKQEKQETTESGEVLSYDNALPLNRKYSDIFSRVEIVPLDTVDNFLISDIRQFRYVLNRIFVLSKEELLIFDRQGKGLARINRYGQGREEYLSVRGFDVSEKDSTICLLTYPQRLMYFSLDGTFLHEHKIEVKGTEMAILPDESYAVFTDNLSLSEDGDISLLDIFNRNGKMRSFIEGYENLGNRMLPSFQQKRTFTHIQENDGVLFFHPLSNRIWSVSSIDSVRVKYTIDFGDNNPPVDAPEKVHQDVMLSDVVTKHWSVWGFNGCWENERYLYIQTFVDKKLRDILFDKKEKQLYKGWMKDDLLRCQKKPVEATDEYLVGFISTEDLIGLENYLKSKPDGEILPEQEKQMIDWAEEAGNPLVCFYYFK